MHYLQCNPHYYRPYHNGHNNTIGDHHLHNHT